ncbi:DUF4259 domain-containing protein [Micromonospora sp. MP36]|uniref:DUF4259 domain-containing protein n=2 Tax=unclassified Micromonospora TaxID=2617518 RepID=UPI00210344F6|nr:DUF4259 domain-containing protein [Micromonospora sp. MP36]
MERQMGAWGEGPFENDSAADWCDGLHDAHPSERRGMVRAALTTAAHTTGYLDYDDAAAAIAAAAIVASRMPGGPPITSTYAPNFLLAGDALELDDDLPELAAEALARVLGDDSEWRELWSEAGATQFPHLEKLRAVLTPTELPGQIGLL